MIDKSELEQQLEKRSPTETVAKVECLCVHGTCREGEPVCQGGCESGWRGPHCDTPAQEQLRNVNRNRQRDYTSGGLYRPQQIND